MKWSKYFISTFLMLFCFLMLDSSEVYATNTDISNLTMVVNSGCYTYSKMNSNKAYRAGYLTFGEEIDVISTSGKYAKFKNDGKTQYILLKNLDNVKYMLSKIKLMVSPTPASTTSSKMLGYIYYGQEVSYLGEVKNSSGVTYIKCLIEKTYESDGKTIKNENIVGYIRKSNLERKSTIKIINQTTNLYNYAFNSNSSASMKESAGKIYMGEQVKLLRSGTAWSKVLYNNKIYYVYNSKLSDYKLEVLIKRINQRKEPNLKSEILNYAYWNTPITVLNTYENSTYGTFLYCKINDEYGFIRKNSKSTTYMGNQSEMITNRNVNLYAKTSSESTIVEKIDTKEKVKVLYKGENWVYVSYNGKKGYIYSSRLDYPEQKINGNYYTTAYRLYKNKSSGTINEKVKVLAFNEEYNYAYIQTSTNKNYWVKYDSLITNKKMIHYTINPETTLHVDEIKSGETIKIPYMTKVEYIGIAHSYTTGKWIKVKYDNKPCFMWMEAGEEYLTSKKSSFKYSSNNTFQKELIELALNVNKLDTKYAHGQSEGIVDVDGKYGFDCSGLASYLLNTTMRKYVPTYRLSKNIDTLYETLSIYNEGYEGEFKAITILDGKLDINLLEPGDIIFFDLLENIGDEPIQDHCGIYLGNGEFIHSSSSWNKVIIMPLTGIYEEGFLKVKRYLPENVISANKPMKTTSKKTYVYSEHTTQSERIATLEIDEDVILHYTNNGNWAYIEYEPNKYGFVLVKYLA